jgi:DNA polymerase elongation subunit (family B)
MGAVAVTEQAIIIEAHSKGFIVPSRPKRDETADNQAAGAYVAYPKKGLHEWIGSMDINSLYPSAIRALNMGPETIVGQLRQDHTKEEIEAKIAKGNSFAAAWEDPEAKFNTAVNKSKHSAISWIPVDNLQATCEAESRKRGLGGFGYPVEACSFWSSSHNVCQVFTRSNATTMHSLGHEIRHCFQGNFH